MKRVMQTKFGPVEGNCFAAEQRQLRGQTGL